MKHHCHAVRCETPCAPRFLMCPKHWAMVPRHLQAEVYRHFNPKQCSADPDRPLPTKDWFTAADAAIEAVAQKEGYRRRKKVELTQEDRDRAARELGFD